MKTAAVCLVFFIAAQLSEDGVGGVRIESPRRAIRGDLVPAREISFEEKVTTEVGARVSALQAELDSWCTRHYANLCRRNQSAFCNKKAFARYGTGLSSQQTREWRCYSEDSLVQGAREVECVDDCGNHFACNGKINPKTTNHSTAQSELLDFIKKNVDRFCSPIQKTGDNFCNSVLAGAVARKDAGRAGQEVAWRCYNKESLTYEASGICKDNCGGERQCPGGRSETEGELVKEHYTRAEELEKAFAGHTVSCGANKVCVATQTNPHLCVDEETLKSGTKHSQLQAMLDTGCQSEFDRICKTGDKAFCGKTVVARKDKGRSAQATAEWRCYAFEELDFEEVTSVCVDNCGEEMRCQGGIKGKESVDHVTWRKLTELLKTGKAEYCPAAQAAANDYCKSVRPESVARYDSGAADSNFKWRCIDKAALRIDVQSRCSDKCGSAVKCAGGRSRVDGPLPSSAVSNEEKGIQAAVDKAKVKN